MSDPATKDADVTTDGIVTRPGLNVAPCGPLGQVTLRHAAQATDEAAAALASALEAVAGVAPPAVLGAAFAPDGRGAVWMAPDEMLLLVPADQAATAVADLEGLLADVPHLALDMSDARAVFRLTGPDAAETLAKGVPVDVSPAGFPVGTARRSHLGQIAVVFWRREAEVWEIACLRSYAHHLAAWLAVAGAGEARVGAFSGA